MQLLNCPLQRRTWRITSCRLRGLCRPLLCGSASWKLWWGWTCLWTSSAPSVALSAGLRGERGRERRQRVTERKASTADRDSRGGVLSPTFALQRGFEKLVLAPFPGDTKRRLPSHTSKALIEMQQNAFFFFFFPPRSEPLHVLVQAADDQVPLVDDGHQLVQQLLVFVPVLLSPVALWSFAVFKKHGKNKAKQKAKQRRRRSSNSCLGLTFAT